MGAEDGYPFLSPVGSFPRGASRWGGLDLAGNVCEWTADMKYRYTAEPGLDPRANTDPRRFAPGGSGRPDTPFEVLEREDPDAVRVQQRGGAWAREIGRTRSGFRVSERPGEREDLTGFRVACDAAP